MLWAPWEDLEGEAEREEKHFFDTFADSYIINKISVPGTRNGLIPHGRARSSVGGCAVIAIPLDGVRWLSGGLA